MGQYHVLVNLDKRQFVHPHAMGCGLKLWEQVGFYASISTALWALLACSNGRGGGDFREHPLVGSWAGDRIAVVGDYAEPDDLAPEHHTESLYNRCLHGDARYVSEEAQIRREAEEEGLAVYTDISPQVREMMTALFDVTYDTESGRGWLPVTSPHDGDDTGKLAPDVVIMVARKPASDAEGEPF